MSFLISSGLPAAAYLRRSLIGAKNRIGGIRLHLVPTRRLQAAATVRRDVVGSKGFAAAAEIIHVVALTSVLSILVHPTDVLVARTRDHDHLPGWRNRIGKARRRPHRTRPGA